LERWSVLVLLTSWLLLPASPRAADLNVQLEVPATPQLIHPGKQLAIPITVRDHTGWGVPGQKLTLGASAGTFGDLTDLGKGNYRAVYRMPGSRYPQAVILAAKLPGQPPVWKALLLQSRTSLPVNTSKPHVMVTLSLGGRQYGPHQTDAEGRVTIPVNVRPGETEARAVAVDEFGNRTTRKVDIPVPRSSRLLGLPERKTLVADGKDRVDIYLIAIHPNGSPKQNASFIAFKKAGQVSRAMKLDPGVYRLRYSAPDRLDPSLGKLTLALKSDPRQSRQNFLFALTTGRPDKIVAQAQPKNLFADGKSKATIQMRIFDHAGHPVSGMQPQLTCSAGVPGPVSEPGEGEYRASLTSPSQPVERVRCRITVLAGEGEPIQEWVEIGIVELVPATIHARCDAAELLADGTSRTRIEVEIRDQRGDPLDGAEIRTRAATGVLGAASSGSRGHYHFSYTAPRIMQDGRVRISVEAGSGDSLVTDHLIISLRAPPPPPRPLPWLSLAPWAGVTTNFGRLTSAAFSLEGTLRLPFAREHLYLGLEGGYRFGRQTVESGIAETSLETRLEYLPLHLALVYKLSPQSDFTPYAGAGGGLEFVQWTLSTGTLSTERGHQILAGAVAWLGAELRLGPGALFVQARYLYAWLSDRSAVEQTNRLGGSLIKGNIGGLELGGGYRLDL